MATKRPDRSRKRWLLLLLVAGVALVRRPRAAARKGGASAPAMDAASAVQASEPAMTGAAALAHPALWPEPKAGEQPRAYSHSYGKEAQRKPPAHRLLVLAWVAVGVIIAGAVLLGFGIAFSLWPLAVAGVVVGLVGGGVAIKSRITQDVAEGTSPSGY